MSPALSQADAVAAAPALRLLHGEADEMATLQRVLERAADYAELVTGSPPGPADAQSLYGILPPEKTYDDKFVFGVWVGREMVGCVDLIRGYPDTGTAHIGLLLLVDHARRRGLGMQVVAQIESFVAAWGTCRRLRIGVLRSNPSAAAFWQRQGFVATGEVRPYAYGAVRSGDRGPDEGAGESHRAAGRTDRRGTGMPLTDPGPIATGRLQVRLQTEADLPALLDVNGCDEVTALLPYATWTSMADAEAWSRRMATLQSMAGALQFVVVDRATDRAIGTCLLFRHEEGSARAELGYVLGRAHWGRGVMREALEGLLDCAFGRMGLRRIEAEVDVRNAASAGLLLRLGFTKEGVLRQRWVAKGEARDVVMFGLLRHEWLQDAAGAERAGH